MIARRHLLKLLAAAPLSAASGEAWSAIPRVTRLMEDAKPLPKISERIDFIARGLMGTRYQGYTLIGSATKPEEMVVRDDAFDCVTFCEVVLAAAAARNRAEFEPELKKIRYLDGKVDWRARNHYWADWCQRNIDNKSCRPVMIGEPLKVFKDVNSEPAVGRRKFVLETIPGERLVANAKLLSPGDIVGFVSRRPDLDYFHTGFIAFGKRGELLARHASRSHRRVVEERIEDFMTANGTRSVTILRPAETTAVAGLR
ncbi:N-acetylmuramoyl-L-alanine amidase-like domain-containing protein [Leptospira sp. severe_002]|uniref:N-acetylmuramoyl-L-alanine amidase-like domain-containing protein n=1 Tax=Leptospira sp. severe_002 TaxID=2838237 RepID=UPI001E2868EC|nr:N-acetylmuramoyl-L-alanine amidase-like domain-containing protein [Leptospira sp. severe_002]